MRNSGWVGLDFNLDKNLALHMHNSTFVGVCHHWPSCCQVTLSLGSSDKHHSIEKVCPPLTVESSNSAEAASLQSVLVASLFSECGVTSKRVAGRDTGSVFLLHFSLYSTIRKTVAFLNAKQRQNKGYTFKKTPLQNFI